MYIQRMDDSHYMPNTFEQAYEIIEKGDSAGKFKNTIELALNMSLGGQRINDFDKRMNPAKTGIIITEKIKQI